MRLILLVLWILTAPSESRAAAPYFSNGDPTTNWLELGFNNIGDGLSVNRRFFEEFTVVEPGGITVTSLWSHNFIPRGTSGWFTNAEWAIRNLMTTAGEGTDMGTGMASLILTPNGQSFSNSISSVTQAFDGYKFLITGISVHLPPGTYSFAVTPHLDQSIPCFDGIAGCSALITTTDGANSLGTPTNNQNGIWRDEASHSGITRYSTQEDLAMGVLATTEPVRPTLALAPDGSGGYFIQVSGAANENYVLQRAEAVTGAWRSSAPRTAPASGQLIFWDPFPPPDCALYRTVRP